MTKIQKHIKQVEREHNMSIEELDAMTKAMQKYCDLNHDCMFVHDGFDISGRHINPCIVFSNQKH